MLIYTNFNPIEYNLEQFNYLQFRVPQLLTKESLEE